MLSEEEGIEFTKNALENKKNLRGIIFALGEDICSDEDISLKLCLDYCHEKDLNYRNKKNHLYLYGAGFNRLLISLSNNPAQVITNLNEKYPLFYDPNSICFYFDRHFSERAMTSKLFLSIIKIENYRVNLFNLKQKNYTDVKEYYTKKENKVFNEFNKALKRQKNNYMVIYYVEEIKEKYIEYLNDKDTEKFYLVSIKNQVIDIYHQGKLYSQINRLNGYYLVHSSHPLHLSFSVFEVIKRRDKDTKESGKVYRLIDEFQNKQKLTFISYSHHDNKDEKKITSFVNELKTIGINTFFDVFNFLPGEDWEEVALSTIESKECKRMISFISENYLQSISCKKEVSKMLKQKNKTIILFDPKRLIDYNTEFYGNLLKLKRIIVVHSRLDLFNCFSFSEIDRNLSNVQLESNYYFRDNVRLAKKILVKKCNYNGNKALSITKHCHKYYLNNGEDKFEYIMDKCDAKAFFINNDKEIYQSDCKKKPLYYYNMKKITF